MQAASLMLVWGSDAYLAALVPRALGDAVARELRPASIAAVALAILAIGLRLPVEAASIGNGWADALDPATLKSVLLETSVGTAWMVQAGAGLLLAAAMSLPFRARRNGRPLAAALGLFGLTFTGHAAMDDGVLGLAHRANDALHLLAGGAWFGALVPLLPILRDLGDADRHRDAVVALRRFSTVGHGAVALVIATGFANAALTLKGWPTDWSRPYLELLVLKVALVATMTGLAIANRYGLVPRMRRDPTAVSWLRLGTIAEIILALAAVAVVSWFGLMDPMG